MKAVILIGGQGTRLRPFTCDTPKPLLPLANKPFLTYQFDLLKAHGIREVILCVSSQSDSFLKELDGGLTAGLKLRYVREKKPLGTGGALKNAESFLDGTTLALNGDILSSLNISAMLAQHRRGKADLTIALAKVKDPTRYGLVVTDPQGHVRKFIEKPSWDEVEVNTINAGIYLFEPELLSGIPVGVPYSLERNFFPPLLATHNVCGFVSPGYWVDIGTIEQYRQAHLDILSGDAPSSQKLWRKNLSLGKKVRLGKDIVFEENSSRVLLGDGAAVGDYASFSGRVCVGPRCRIGRGARLENCVVLAGTEIGDGARLEGCIVGRDCSIGVHSHLGPAAALGFGCKVAPYSRL